MGSRRRRLLQQCVLVLWLTVVTLGLLALYLQCRSIAQSSASSSNGYLSRFTPHFQFASLPGHEYALAVYIRSAPDEFQLRSMMRRGWLREARARGVFAAFVVGNGRPDACDSMGHSQAKSPNNTTRTTVPIPWNMTSCLALHHNLLRLETESRENDDILFGDFVDSYRNLSRKAYFYLSHFRTHAAASRAYLLQVNTDSALHVPHLLAFIHSIDTANQTSRAMYGECSCYGPCSSKRNKTNGIGRNNNKKEKAYVPKAILPALARWPHYCDGYGLLLGPGVVGELLQLAGQHLDWVKSIHIDDVLYSGLFRNELDIPMRPAPMAGGFFWQTRTKQRRPNQDLHPHNESCVPPGLNLLHPDMTCAVRHLKQREQLWQYLADSAAPSS